jgi:hypothetical protein
MSVIAEQTLPGRRFVRCRSVAARQCVGAVTGTTAGALGAALLAALLDAGCLARRPGGRAVAVTPRAAAGLRGALGLDAAALAPLALEPAALRRVA